MKLKQFSVSRLKKSSFGALYPRTPLFLKLRLKKFSPWLWRYRDTLGP